MTRGPSSRAAAPQAVPTAERGALLGCWRVFLPECCVVCCVCVVGEVGGLVWCGGSARMPCTTKKDKRRDRGPKLKLSLSLTDGRRHLHERDDDAVHRERGRQGQQRVDGEEEAFFFVGARGHDAEPQKRRAGEQQRLAFRTGGPVGPWEEEEGGGEEEG